MTADILTILATTAFMLVITLGSFLIDRFHTRELAHRENMMHLQDEVRRY